MATYTPTTTLTHYTGSSSSSTAATIFQASASGATYLSGVFAGTNISTNDSCNLIITPTPGSTSAAGAVTYGVSVGSSVGQGFIQSAGIAGSQINPVSGSATGFLSSNVACALSNTVTGYLSFEKVLIPPGYYVQFKTGSAVATIKYSLTQEAIV